MNHFIPLKPRWHAVALRLVHNFIKPVTSVLHINHLNGIYCAWRGLFEEYFF